MSVADLSVLPPDTTLCAPCGRDDEDAERMLSFLKSHVEGGKGDDDDDSDLSYDFARAGVRSPSISLSIVALNSRVTAALNLSPCRGAALRSMLLSMTSCMRFPVISCNVLACQCRR